MSRPRANIPLHKQHSELGSPLMTSVKCHLTKHSHLVSLQGLDPHVNSGATVHSIGMSLAKCHSDQDLINDFKNSGRRGKLPDR